LKDARGTPDAGWLFRPVRTRVPMTAQGSAFTRLRRALDHRNAVEALAAARELQHVGLAEALELVLLLRDSEPDKLGRAALRWHGRLCREVPDLTIDEGQAVLAALAAYARQALRDLGM